MKFLILPFLTLLCLSSFGQSNNTAEFPHNFLDQTYWPDTIISNQIKYWPNGNIKIKYEYLRDSLRLRKDFYESGNLKSSAEVFQQLIQVVRYAEDLDTGEKIVYENTAYDDVLNGLYLEYKNEFGSAPIAAKSFNNDTYSGEYINHQSCCNCPFVLGRTDTTLKLLDEKTIFLCGYPIEVGKETFFSEFTLGLCGQEPISGSWKEQSLCKIYTQSDTLFVEETISLPIGEDMEYQKTNWSVEKFHYVNKELIQSISINRNIRKYSKKEINQTIKLYENRDIKSDADILDLMNKLFVATISGDLKSREYFKNLPTKFTKFEGENLQVYQVLEQKLVLWDSGM